MSREPQGSDEASSDGIEVQVGASTPQVAIGAEVRRGEVGVFAGDWAWYEASGVRRQPVGFVGVLVDTWDGWAVFGCVRDVAEAVVARHRYELGSERAALRALGFTGSDLEDRFAASTIRMWFDGDDIVVDERTFHADQREVTRLSADEQGSYVIGGYVWPWISVDAADCDRIVGQR